MRTALVAGGTGLVGGAVVERLVEEPGWDRVVSLARRRVGWEHPKLVERRVDFERLEADDPVDCDSAFCALGTTRKKAGSKRAFRRVDHDYVVRFARAAHSGGATQFLLVSSIGADAGSRNFYLSVKGATEEAVRAIGFDSLEIFRPGLLLGERPDDRPLERLGSWPVRALRPLMVGPLIAYCAVRAEIVAAAMVAAARDPQPGIRVHTYREMVALAARVLAARLEEAAS